MAPPQKPVVEHTPAALVTTPKTAPTTAAPLPSNTFSSDGTTTAAQTSKVPTTTGGPVKGGVLGFLLAQKSAPALEVGPAIMAGASNNPSMEALLALRVACPPQYAPHVEVVTAAGAVITGALKGVDANGHAVIDSGLGRQQRLAMDEPLRAVRHQMDTDGDLHTALVTVFDAATRVTDPWQLQAFAGKTLTIETFDVEHQTLAAAAKRGDVSGSPMQITGGNADGLLVAGGSVLKADWQIASIAISQPAYSYKKDGQRLADVGTGIARGTAVDVTLPGGRSLRGTFLGVAKDAEGSDYVVVEQKNGVRQALREVVDVKADATTRQLWQHPDYASVYG